MSSPRGSPAESRDISRVSFVRQASSVEKYEEIPDSAPLLANLPDEDDKVVLTLFMTI
jgi:hypothetical protein